VPAPPFTQYAAAAPADPTIYTSLPEKPIPTAEEVAGETVVLVGRGNDVAVPFSQYAAVVLPVVPLTPAPATYTSPPETAIAFAP
jgi:hypothetical protein